MSEFTREHRGVIAEQIKCTLRYSLHNDYQTLFALAERLSLQFKKDNPNFDETKFLEACGF